MQEFSLIIAAILRKENCVNIALFILIHENSKPSNHNDDDRDSYVNLRYLTQFLRREETENPSSEHCE